MAPGKTFNFYAMSPHDLLRSVDISVSSTPTPESQFSNLLDLIEKNSISTHSPYFMNQLFSGVRPELKVIDQVLRDTKTTMATYEASPVFSLIEREVISSLGRLAGWCSSETDGVVVPGGSAANFMALHCARQKHDPSIRKNGLKHAPEFKIFVSKNAHYSLRKACLVLGFGENAIVEVGADANGKMDLVDLRSKISYSKEQGFVPLFINATAGTTVLGAFDDIKLISEIARRESIWLHVDGAWGGPALFSDSLRPLMTGIESSDSFSFDAHKLFGAGLTSTVFLTRHPHILLEANDVSGADYLFHQDQPIYDLGKRSWQCGRKPESFAFWLLWKLHGTKGLGQEVNRLLEVRDQSIRWIREQNRLQLVAEPTYLNICVRIGSQDPTRSQEWSRLVREHLKSTNTAFVNFASDENGTFLRIILAHPEIKFEHVRTVLEKALEFR